MRKTAALAVTTTASGGIGLIAIAWLATRRLGAPELGFFFSFLSLGALVQLADFGLSLAALQTAGTFVGTGRAAELPALARRVSRWTLAASTVATCLVAAIGWAVFSARRAGTPGIHWQAPWLGYLFGVFLAQLTIPGISLREGSGKVRQVWSLRLIQECVSSLVCLLALEAGAGLWSLAAFVFARAVISSFWLTLRDPIQARPEDLPYPLGRWMREVWPFQWKIGMSWLSGFLIFRIFAPVIFVEKGPVAAGQFGLAISLMNLLISISSAWPLSQAARFAALNAARRFDDLRRDFPMTLLASTTLSVLGAMIGAVVLWQAREKGVLFALRLPEPRVTALLLAAAVAHHVVFCFAVFLRSEGREPLLVPSVVLGIATASAIWTTAHFGTLTSIAVANLVCAVIGIPVVLFLFRGWPHLAIDTTAARGDAGVP